MNARIGVQLNHNKRMQEFLRANGFDYVTPKYIDKGSLRGSWRLYSCSRGGRYDEHKWTIEIAEKLNSLGFTDLFGKPLNQFSGNGGIFIVFVRGHDEMLDKEKL